MELLLQRAHLYDTCTIGDLFVDGQRACFTLEDRMRELADQPVSVWKVQDRTAIPVGRYEVVVSFSDRFRKPLPLLLNVPGFSGIRIHSGNTDADTSGCVLLGQTWAAATPDFVGASRAAFDAFFPRLQAAMSAGKCWITVANPPTV